MMEANQSQLIFDSSPSDGSLEHFDAISDRGDS